MTGARGAGVAPRERPRSYLTPGNVLEEAAIPFNLTDGDIVELTNVFKVNQQYCYCVNHFTVGIAGAGVVTDANLLSQMDLDLSTIAKTWLSQNASWHGSKLQIIRPARIDPVINIANQGVGSRASEALPSQASFVVAKRTTFANRRRKGRMYLPGFAEDESNTTGIPNATASGAVTSFADQLLTGWAVAGTGTAVASAVWVLFSREDNLFIPITSFALRSFWGTQRRRSNLGKPDVAPF